MINIYKQPKSANTYANLFIQEISDNVENVCLLFIGHLETIYNILVAKPGVNFTVIDGEDTTEALPYIYNGANLKESITFEDGWCEANDTFVEGLHSIFDNMSFDLVIANPPYGLNNSIAKKIIPVVLSQTKDLVVLVPKNTYKSKACLDHVKKLSIVDNVFEDAAVQNLSIALLNRDYTNTEITMESISLSPKQLQLATAIREYNKTHSKPYNRLKFSGAPIGNKMEKTIEKAALSGICDYLKPIADMKLKDARDAGLFFVTTVWTPSNGVHTSHAHDWTYNLEGKWDPDWDRMCPINAFVFLNKQERDNFSKWWYSCLEREQGKKLRSGLTNACLDLCRDAISSGGSGYEIYFPNIDWSHPHTDKEILKEIGLPEDFLEKE